MTWQCLDLFSGLGGFSAAFEDSGDWDVTTVDIKARFGPDIQADVFNLRPSDFEREFDVVLASPPCTEFSTANQLNGGHQPAGDAVALAHHTIGLMRGLVPRYWVLENPRGLLRRYLGQPTATVTYCQYGEPYMKPTDLWGQHPPITYRRCPRGADCHTNTREGTNAMRYQHGRGSPAERAKVPYDLSDAIREACEVGLRGEAPEQVELGEVAQ